jgi:hypothetical protein
VEVDRKLADAVIDAFRTALESGRRSAECYRAGVEAWRERHPDHSRQFAAKQAVSIMLDADRSRLRGE